MSKVTVIDHPLVQHKLALLRDKETGTKAFRELVSELAMLMGYEVTRDLPLQDVEVETPITKASFKMLANEKLAVVPILRAGLGMADGMMNLIPHAKMGHIGLYRNPDTLMPTGYYCKLPDGIENMNTILLDPMLATGGSACDAIAALKERGVKKIKFMAIIGAPEGVSKVAETHPDVQIYVSTLDRQLNDNYYILPGLGDAGDRLFGTK